MTVTTMVSCDLRNFLQLSPALFDRWRAKLPIVGTKETDGKPENLYAYSDIEALLQVYPNPRYSSNQVILPELAEQLYLGSMLELPALMIREQAAAFLGLSLDALDAALDCHIPSIFVENEVRIPLGAVIDYIEAQKSESVVRLDFVEKILDARSRTKVHEMSTGHDNWLTKQHMPPHRDVYITTQSLMQYLSENTSGTNDWWGLRRKDNFGPLLGLNQASEKYSIKLRLIRAATEEDELPCLYLPATKDTPRRQSEESRIQYRIPQKAFEQWVKWREVMPVADFAALFGVDSEHAQLWIDTKKWCPGKLYHSERMRNCPTLRCAHQFIAANQITTFEPQKWTARKLSGRGTATCISVSESPGDLEQKVHQDIAEGRLYAVKLPDGRLAVMGAE